MPTPRFYSWIRISGAALTVGFVLIGIATGLRQQRPGLDPSQVDCEYRIKILRDRLINQLELAPASPRAVRAFANLLRDTQTACADTDPRLNAKISTIESIAQEHESWRRRSAEAREELREL